MGFFYLNPKPFSDAEKRDKSGCLVALLVLFLS